MSSGRVVLVGAGPGDPGLLTLRAAQVLAHADVLLYDALASDPIVALAPPSCERIYVGKRAGDHAMPQEEIEALMVERARKGNVVVRLKGGDPYVFGRGGEEAMALHEAAIPFEIVPGVSSAIAAPAYAGIPVTHRDFNAAFTVATGHEDPTLRPAWGEGRLDWSKLADPDRTLVLLMAMGNLAGICERLAEHGLRPDTPVAVIQDGTRPTQRTVTGTLATIAGEAERAGLEAPAIVVVGRAVSLRERLRWYDRMPLFGKRVLITRPARQAADFARVLFARGVEPILASTIAIAPPDDPVPAHRAIDALAAYRWLVFTSQNGVDAFFERLAALDCDARYLGGTKVAAIGAKTAQRLRERGIRPEVVPQAFVGEEIARALVEGSREGDRMLIYRAQEARDVLPQMLEDANRKPHVVAAYKTVFETDPQFAQKVAYADVLTFTSSSTVRGFSVAFEGDAAASEAARGKLVACIGPIAAQTAAEIGLKVDVTADVFTTDGLLDALEAHFARRA
jgi:uroporphyrinogen III methyltransferase / synthase